jgi:hypothetical protein
MRALRAPIAFTLLQLASGIVVAATLTISGQPATQVIVGNAYSFTPTVTSSSGRRLAFTVTNKPAWASFNRRNGTLSGVPLAAAVGSYAGIAIAVNDGRRSASLLPFSVQVLAANPADIPPKISGTPPTSATVGIAYQFQPSASDPDGQTLSFGIANKPAWASFSATTGVLSGTPTTAGVYPNVAIAVSDGIATATLAPFTISVATPVVVQPNGSAVLTWTAPTLNTDGTPLTNLAGYKVLYGMAPAQLGSSLQVPGAGSTTVSIEGLAPGTYYFSVEAYTTNGVASAPTPTVSKSI